MPSTILFKINLLAWIQDYFLKFYPSTEQILLNFSKDMNSNPFRLLRREILSIYIIYLLMDLKLDGGLEINSILVLSILLALALDQSMGSLTDFVGLVFATLQIIFCFSTSCPYSFRLYSPQLFLVTTNSVWIAIMFQIVNFMFLLYTNDSDNILARFHYGLLSFMLLLLIRSLLLNRLKDIQKLKNQKELLKNQIQKLDSTVKESDNFHQKLITKFSKDIQAFLADIMSNIDHIEKFTTEPNHNSEHIKTIKLDCEVLGKHLETFEDCCKAKSNTIEINYRSFNIRKILEKCWLLCSKIFKQKGLNGELLLHKNTPTLLVIDPDRIRQILLNLAQNFKQSVLKEPVRVIVSWIPTQLEGIENISTKRSVSVEGESLVNRKNIQSSNVNQINEEELDFLGTSEAIDFHLMNYFKLDSKCLRFPKGNHQRIYGTDGQYSGFLQIQLINSQENISADVSRDSSGEPIFYEKDKLDLNLWIAQILCQRMGGDLLVNKESNNAYNIIAKIKAEISPQSIGTPTPSPSQLKENRPSKVFMKTMKFLNLPYKYQPSVLSRITKEEEMKLNALLLGDMNSEQQLTKRFLEACGVEVKYMTNNGVEAFSEFTRNNEASYDLCIIDADVGNTNKIATCVQIREYEKSHRLNPITMVILASNCNEENLIQYLDKKGSIRANYLYKKPFSLQDCQNLVRIIRNEKLRKTSSLKSKLNVFSRKTLIYEKDIFQQVLLENYLKVAQINYKLSNKEELQKEFAIGSETINAILYSCQANEEECISFAKEVQSLIKKNNYGEVPLFGIIGSNNTDKINTLKKAGFKEFLVKPFDYEDVVRLLSHPTPFSQSVWSTKNEEIYT